MRIAFLLPRVSRAPIGGYSVVYRYARHLAQRGHDVEVVHLALVTPPWWRSVVAEVIRRGSAHGTRSARVSWAPSGLRLTAFFAFPTRRLRGFDRVVATSWRTAELIGGHPTLVDKAAYLIQSYETWSGPAERVDATWRLPIKRIAIARWLIEKAAELGAPEPLYVPNGIAVDEWPVRTPPHLRQPSSVAMLWHADPVKGSDCGLQALELAHEAVPALRADIVSIYPRQPGLPEWVSWHQRPSHDQLVAIYNRNAMWLSPSRMEGWALPPAEAMTSKCALVSTDIGGVADYAVDDVTAVLADADDPAGLAARIVCLASDPSRRVALAEAGHALIASTFSAEEACRRFEEALLEPS